MSEYKLVPVEPTPEMEQAAEKYWNERKFKALSGDPRTWKGLYTAMLAAAPDVQGEPVGYGLLGAISKNWDGKTFVPKDEADGYDGSALLPLYAAPQPAEQQPAPDVAGVAEDADLLPSWKPCNPGCDPEFNGDRSRYCADLCEAARSAFAAHRKQGGEV